MARFLTKRFLKGISKSGRLLDALDAIESMSTDARFVIPSLPKLTSWECVLEEVLDSDHDPEYYLRFAKELLDRGYSRDDIELMRMVVWETAGWFNFEMMAWEWCQLDKDDMMLGLQNRLQHRNISKTRYEELVSLINKYETPPYKAAATDAEF